MRRPSFFAMSVAVCALVLLMAAGATASPRGSSAKTRISFVTPTVSPGGTVTIKAQTGAHLQICIALLYRPGGTAKTSIRLTPHQSHGSVSWTSQLPRGAPSGTWRAYVSCGLDGSASKTFKVGAPPIAPAQVSVVKSGFSTETFGADTFLYCGVQLQNTSTTDARNLVVTVVFADTQGRSLTSAEIDLTLIPAGQTFYASCLKLSHVTLAVSALQVSVKVGKTTAKGPVLPSVSGVKLTKDQYGSTQTLTGNLTSPYSKPMPESAEIYAVFFDASGNIVGGDSTRAGASVQPGATVGFSFSYIAANVASAQVSVDPCGYASTFNDCPVP
jgi:hypothetical protein